MFKSHKHIRCRAESIIRQPWPEEQPQSYDVCSNRVFTFKIIWVSNEVLESAIKANRKIFDLTSSTKNIN